MTTDNQQDLTGALTLLRDCVGGQRGERLLIVSEAENTGFYDDQAPKLVAEMGETLGMHVFQAESKSFIQEDEKSAFIHTLAGYDHVVFFSRIGDQIRFSKDAQLPSTTMCYTLNHESLNSPFGKACHHGMEEIKDAIDHAFETASEIRVTCPKGTDISGQPQWLKDDPVEVSVKRFPLLVPRPVPAAGFSGTVALSRFLLGTGSRHYDPYYLSLPSDVVAHIDNTRITRFEGTDADVKRVEEHYLNVSNQFDIDPWHVDSWHAGIHPACHFETDAEADILRWSGTAFGNPRLLHFHTCGNYAPGEISWNILDPTIYLDDVALWENGQLYPNRIAEAEILLKNHPILAELFANPYRKIGLNA